MDHATKALLGIDLPTPCTDKMVELWSECQDMDVAAQSIMVDPLTWNNLRIEDVNMVNTDRQRGDSWRGIPVDVNYIQQAMTAGYCDPDVKIEDVSHGPCKLMTIKFKDRRTGRTGYLDAPDNSEHVTL